MDILNYVKPIGCFLIDRYTPDDGNIDNISYQNKDEMDWLKFDGTKKELKDKIISDEIRMYHTNLGCFRDDIIIISEIVTDTENEAGRYMFFWFDMDSSDCSIGRFETTDTKEEVIQSVIVWLEECKLENENKVVEEHIDNGIVNYTELPISFLNGWIKF